MQQVCKKLFLNPDSFGAEFKVYTDGHHFIGTVISNFKEKRRKHFNYRNDMDDLFDILYLQAIKQGIKGEELKIFIKNGLVEEYGEILNIDTYLEKRIKIKIHNFYVRLKRFRRKANLNVWNYFTTFTFDSNKMNADTFRKRLRKCLSNLHVRHNWRYMGVFELSPEENRLHFHALMYIPKGEMVGEIFEDRSYSTKKKAMQITHINTFFQKRFGRCDFAEIKKEDLKYGGTANYLTKYINKTGENIVYSRGIPSEFYLRAKDEDVAVTYDDFILKYIFFDDVVNSDDLFTLFNPTICQQQRL